MNDLSSSITNERQRRRTRAKFSKRNKQVVFKALAAAGITAVAACFDRKSDRFLITREHASRGETRVKIPHAKVFIWTVPHQGQPFRKKEALTYAIFNLCWDSLEEKHPEWGRDAIALGEFRFDVMRPCPRRFCRWRGLFLHSTLPPAGLASSGGIIPPQSLSKSATPD